jgi:hypothetical protein
MSMLGLNLAFDNIIDETLTLNLSISQHEKVLPIF